MTGSASLFLIARRKCSILHMRPLLIEGRSGISVTTMNVEWDFTGQAFFDQLAQDDRARVMKAVEKLAKDWDSMNFSHVQRLKTGNDEVLYTLRVDKDIRVLFVLNENVLVVVDIVRSNQIEKLVRQWR